MGYQKKNLNKWFFNLFSKKRNIKTEFNQYSQGRGEIIDNLLSLTSG